MCSSGILILTARFCFLALGIDIYIFLVTDVPFSLALQSSRNCIIIQHTQLIHNILFLLLTLHPPLIIIISLLPINNIHGTQNENANIIYTQIYTLTNKNRKTH